MFKLTEKQFKNFWKKVDRESSEKFYNGTRCWKWIAHKDRYGYGVSNYGGKNVGAHRISWALYNGYIPVGYSVCRYCDNPECVNPAHLFKGTHLENMTDMNIKKRTFRFKLKDVDLNIAINIINLYYTDNVSIKDISRALDVSAGIVLNIIKGIYFRNLFKGRNSK